MRTTYAVVWREDGGQTRAGKLELRARGLRLEGAGDVRDLPFSELAGLRVGQGLTERLNGKPALVVDCLDGTVVRISTLQEAGALLELADKIAAFELGEEAVVKRLLVVVPIRPGSRGRVRELLDRGPPFDPRTSGLDRHEVFLTEREALFLFETHQGPAFAEKLLTTPGLLRAAAAWRAHLAGPPRVAEALYSWARRATQSGAR